MACGSLSVPISMNARTINNYSLEWIVCDTCFQGYGLWKTLEDRRVLKIHRATEDKTMKDGANADRRFPLQLGKIIIWRMPEARKTPSPVLPTGGKIERLSHALAELFSKSPRMALSVEVLMQRGTAGTGCDAHLEPAQRRRRDCYLIIAFSLAAI